MPDSIIKVNNITSLNGLHGPGFPDGSAESPSFNFINEPTSGIYRISDGLLGISIKGVKAAEINLDGIKGSQGIQGPIGPIGPQGIQGIQGERGLQGETGSIGLQGPRGETGPQGVQGLQGKDSNFVELTGLIFPSFSNIVPEGFFLCDGSAKSRTDFSNLFAIAPKVQGTITVASSNTITWTSHELATGHSIQFTTSGVLPTGLNIGVVYYVRFLTINTFSLYTTLAQSMNTSSTTGQVSFTASGSGIHTGLVYYWGNGDGSTTFNIPDTRGIHLRGIGSPQNFLDSTNYTFSMGQKIDDTVQNHSHTLNNNGSAGYSLGGSGGYGAFQSYGSMTGLFGTGLTVSDMNSGRIASETRVKSIAVNYFIKY